jgi:hypothetical protein
MQNRSSRKPLSRDVNQMAKSIVELATREGTEIPDVGDEAKNPAAVALGRLGGLKGGKARAALLTQKQRTAIARKAAKTRWAGIKRKGK